MSIIFPEKRPAKPPETIGRVTAIKITHKVCREGLVYSRELLERNFPGSGPINGGEFSEFVDHLIPIYLKRITNHD